MAYPKYMYKGNESRMVHSKEEQDSLGTDWKDEHVGAEYPKWRYHATQEPRLVGDKKEEDALGSGWGDKPVEKPKPHDVDQVTFAVLLYLRSLGYSKMKSLEDAQRYIDTLSPKDREDFYLKAKEWEKEENAIDEKLQAAKAPKKKEVVATKLADTKPYVAAPSGQVEGDTNAPLPENAKPAVTKP